MNISPQAIPDKMSHLMGYGGIALAFVEGLVIRDNFIVDNCRDCRDPICGIYVLAATALDISRNEITEHLSQNFDEVNSGTVKIGPRGGIWVFIALGQMDALSGLRDKRYGQLDDVFQKISGSHAARIDENVVSVPLGRSLTMTILGDASILGNRFTSYGIVPVNILELFMSIFIDERKRLDMSGVLQLLSLLAGNILIFDLGSFVIFKEFKRLQAGVAKGNFGTGETGGNLNHTVGAARLTEAYAGLEAASRIINLFTRAGMVHFSDNQCKLNPLKRETSIAYSSIFIIGLADSGFHDNQTSCNIPRSLMITNASLFGGTQRVTGNWLKETFLHVGFSAITFGILNATTDNESVHCLNVAGIQRLDRDNLILGAILYGATGDVAEDETREKLLEACSRNNTSRIFRLMYFAIMQDQGDTATNAEVKSYFEVNG